MPPDRLLIYRSGLRKRLWRPALAAVGLHVGHHVVAQLLLQRLGDVEVDIVAVRAQLGELLIGDVEAEFLLGLGQGYPEAAPGAELLQLAPVLEHGLPAQRAAKGEA